MKRNLKYSKFAIFGGIALIMVAGLTLDASAQFRWEPNNDRYEQQQRRVERERRQRQRERQRQQRNRRGNDRQNDITYFPGTQRQADNAGFRQGYQQGLIAGQYDARKRKYNNSNVYRDSGRNPNNGDVAAADYIYRQGYLEGYNDGFYGRRQY